MLVLTTGLYELVALAYGVFALILVVRGLRTATARYFTAALVGTALWAQFVVLTAQGFLPLTTSDAMSALRDAAWLALSLALVYQRAGNRHSRWLTSILTAALISFDVFLSLTPGGMGTAAGIHIDAALMRVCIAILGFALIENVLRNSPRSDFWALKHWAIGLSGILFFQLIVRVPEFLTHNPIFNQSLASPLVFLVALPFFVVSSTRIPQVQLRIHSSRAFVFHTTTFLGAGVLLQGTALAAWYVRSYGGTNATALAIVVAFTGFVGIAAAVSSGAVRSRVRVLINEYFFAFKYDYRIEWEKVIRGLTSDLDTPIAERALGVLCDLLDTPGGSLWLYRDSWKQFISSAKFGMTVHVMSLREDDKNIEILRKDLRSLIQFTDAEGTDQQYSALWSFVDEGRILIPLRQRSSLVGFAILAKPRADRFLDWEDEALVRLVAMQVTAYLVQEETSQSLADARQLEDFNKRFAFIVHDVKNTLGQLSLMVRNISQFGDRKEFRDDMVITLGNAVDRLTSLLASLTAVGSQPVGSGSQRRAVDLNEFLDTFCNEKRGLGYALNFEKLSGGALTLTDSDALRRVLEHVLSNALEASPNGSPVDVALKPKEDLFLIKVTDRGDGMTQQFIKDELFRPLKTTKRGGSGLGAFQIRELMRALNGDVTVESQVGKGTEVTLSLPRILSFAET